MRALKIGPGIDPDAEMGPLVTREHRQKVRGYVDLGIKEGANLVVDGRGLHCRAMRKGTSSAAGCSTTSVPTCGSTGKRSSGRCSAWSAHRTLPAPALVNAHEYGNGVALFT